MHFLSNLEQTNDVVQSEYKLYNPLLLKKRLIQSSADEDQSQSLSFQKFEDLQQPTNQEKHQVIEIDFEKIFNQVEVQPVQKNINLITHKISQKQISTQIQQRSNSDQGDDKDQNPNIIKLQMELQQQIPLKNDKDEKANKLNKLTTIEDLQLLIKKYQGFKKPELVSKKRPQRKYFETKSKISQRKNEKLIILPYFSTFVQTEETKEIDKEQAACEHNKSQLSKYRKSRKGLKTEMLSTLQNRNENIKAADEQNTLQTYFFPIQESFRQSTDRNYLKTQLKEQFLLNKSIDLKYFSKVEEKQSSKPFSKTNLRDQYLKLTQKRPTESKSKSKDTDKINFRSNQSLQRQIKQNVKKKNIFNTINQKILVKANIIKLEEKNIKNVSLAKERFQRLSRSHDSQQVQQKISFIPKTNSKVYDFKDRKVQNIQKQASQINKKIQNFKNTIRLRLGIQRSKTVREQNKLSPQKLTLSKDFHKQDFIFLEKPTEQSLGVWYKNKSFQISDQLAKIFENSLIDKYLTIKEVEKLISTYVQPKIEPKRWIILIVDEVYKKIKNRYLDKIH